MFRAGYSLLLWVALPFIALKLWFRGRREPGYHQWLGERFGYYKSPEQGRVIWFHAVSVGEARASVPLVKAMRSLYPDCLALVTCMTAAGREALEQAFGDDVRVCFLPYDYPFAIRRFLGHFRPRLGVLMETEIWPNLLAECKRRAVPVALANARMSQRSMQAYQALARLSRPAFEALAVVCAQSDADAARLASLGAKCIVTCGNLKFDVGVDEQKLAEGKALKASLGGRQVVALASTRAGEEDLLMTSFLARSPKNVFVIIVPRHPQRFGEVARLMDASGIDFSRRTGGALKGSESMLLGDTMGEMATYFAAADVTVIGGTFLPFGGQNFIEACAIGLPVILGPHVHNFSEATRLAIDCGAAVQVGDADAAISMALELLADPARRAAMGAAALKFASAHRGATQRHIAAIQGLLEKVPHQPTSVTSDVWSS